MPILPEFNVGKEKGSHRSIVDEKNGIIYTQWLDRKLVTVASNRYSCEPLVTVTAGKGNARKEVRKPASVVRYNSHMGGVDLLDFFLSINRPRIRSNKWYWPIYAWVLGVSLVAGWKLWLSHSNDNQNRKAGFAFFLRQVNKAIRQEFPAKIQNTYNSTHNSHSNARYDLIDHMIVNSNGSRRCA